MNWFTVGKVIAKIKVVFFLRHSVYTIMLNLHCIFMDIAIAMPGVLKRKKVMSVNSTISILLLVFLYS